MQIQEHVAELIAHDATDHIIEQLELRQGIVLSETAWETVGLALEADLAEAITDALAGV